MLVLRMKKIFKKFKNIVCTRCMLRIDKLKTKCWDFNEIYHDSSIAETGIVTVVYTT